jgi:hypothetical protein
MLGGINNGLFLQSFGGVLALGLIIPLMRWAFETPKAKAERKQRKALKKSLRRLKAK